jgi:thioesterase domain-containing protein
LLSKKFTRVFFRARTAHTGTSVQDLIDLSDHPPEQRKLWEAHVRALIQHRAGSYPGRVTLLRSAGHQFLCSFDPTYGWSSLATGGVTVKVVPGAHESILEEAHVKAVAVAMQTCLVSLPGPSAGQEKNL